MNDDHQGQSLKQPAIRDSIAAPMMGAVLSTLMRQGGVASLLIIALVPERSELAIGLAFLIMQWSMLARVFAAPFVDLTSRQQFLLRWGKIAAGCSALLVSAPLVAWLGRVVMYSRLPDPPPSRTGSETPSWRDVVVPLRDRPFVEFVLLALLFTVVQQAAVPFVVPFLKTELGFPASTTLYGTACFGLGSALALVTWGRLADAWGTRLVFALGSVVGAALLLLLPLLGRLPRLTGSDTRGDVRRGILAQRGPGSD